VSPQYCDTLAGLYGYLQRRLIQAHAEKSESMLQEVPGLIQTLLEGWLGAMDNLSRKQNAEPEAAVQSAPGVSVSNSYSGEPGEPQNRSWQF
jgi:hypothetical protein